MDATATSETPSKPLGGLRILIPPSRLERNPLVPMFVRMGAEVVTFPRLREAPVNPAPLDDAAQRLGEFDWIVIAGGGSADHLFARLALRGLDPKALRAKVGAIGFSALKALRSHGVEADYRPREHFATAVVQGMEPVQGLRVLLIRAQGATDALPAHLVRQGARVEALTGHAVAAETNAADLSQTFGRRLDLAAFANPATVRLLQDAFAQVGAPAEHCLAGVPLFAIGPTTAGAMVAAGLPPDYVAGGRLKPLLDEVVALAGGPVSPR